MQTTLYKFNASESLFLDLSKKGKPNAEYSKVKDVKEPNYSQYNLTKKDNR